MIVQENIFFYSGLVLTSFCEGVAIATYSYMEWNDPGLYLVTSADIGLLVSAVHIWALAFRLWQAIRKADKSSIINENFEKPNIYNNYTYQSNYQATNSTSSQATNYRGTPDKPTTDYYYCPASLAVCCPILDSEESTMDTDTLDSMENDYRTSTSDGISVGAW